MKQNAEWKYIWLVPSNKMKYKVGDLVRLADDGGEYDLDFVVAEITKITTKRYYYKLHFIYPVEKSKNTMYPIDEMERESRFLTEEETSYFNSKNKTHNKLKNFLSDELWIG